MRRRLHFVLLLAVGLTSAVEARASTLTLRVRHAFAGAPLRLGEQTLTNAAGNVLSVTRLDYLLSDFRLVSSDGSEVVLTNQVAFLSVEQARDAVTLSNVPAGRFGAIRFRVGLPPSLNHFDPAKFAAGDPLNPTVNGLHWGWQGGYVFLALEGNWRRADGATDGYSFHLATDALDLPVEVGCGVGELGPGEIPLVLDVARIFTGTRTVRLQDSTTSTHSRGTDPLARVLGDNLVRAFQADPSAPARPVLGATPSLRIEVATNATPYRFKVPGLFPMPALPRDNPLTDEGVALGRRLFNDAALSVNGRQSCAGCHQATAAFTDVGKRLSAGAEGRTGTRNAMPLENLAWQSAFFWDGRAATLRDQVLQPVQNPAEMHESLTNVVRKLDRAGYGPAFAAAFGGPEITADRVARALEQYLLTLVSHDSKFDRVARVGEILTAEEQRGFELFHTEYDPRRGLFGADCFHCHGGALFTDSAFHNNGLDLPEATPDEGRSAVTGRAADFGKFKTPSLRNVAVTAPYMHDGRFNTLEEAVAHYCSGVKRGGTLDPNLAKHPDGGLALGAADQKALVAFLRTLTDARYESGAARP